MKENIRFISSLALVPKEKVGFHSADADGIISAVILKQIPQYSELVFIPLTYQELHHPELGRFLSALNWIAILDLMPFHKNEIDLYCDHHLSVKKMEKRANIVLYDDNSPSAALLLAKYFSNHLPTDLKLLANLTSITDTNSFSIPPPVEFDAPFISLSTQKQAWLLNDLCRTPETSEEALELVQALSTELINIYENEYYIRKVKTFRTMRKESIRIAEAIEISEVILIIHGRRRISTSAIASNLFNRGVKITCVLYPGKRFTGVSFRMNSKIDDQLLDKYRVDLIASKFSGGGHPRAAGGRGESLESTLEMILNWVNENKFTYVVHDLRDNSNT